MHGYLATAIDIDQKAECQSKSHYWYRHEVQFHLPLGALFNSTHAIWNQTSHVSHRIHLSFALSSILLSLLLHKPQVDS